MERIGLFGGTFNPVHNGHLQAASEVRTAFALDRVLFIPSYIPPHKESRGVASAADRLRMVELACLGREGFVASAIEVEARERSYSILTVGKVKALHPGARLFFILGVDAFLEIGTWREYERVLDECRFIVTSRPGFDLEAGAGVLDGRLRGRTCRVAAGGPVAEVESCGVFLLPIRALPISATEVRDRVRSGGELEGLVPPAVAAYIRDRHLYSEP